MTFPVLLHGPLAAHRRGKILRESFSAEPATSLPENGAVIMAFADGFQGSAEYERKQLVEWTRAAGHMLLLLPPFAAGACECPVSWRAERMEGRPRGGEGLARILMGEVTHRLDGKLQTPSLPGATWSDLSVCLGIHRLHPAAGLLAVTCLPIWSLAVLDAPEAAHRWLASLVTLAGEAKPVAPAAETPLSADHYGLLVFLLSRRFEGEEQALAALHASPVFRIAPERALSLLQDLRARGLVIDANPTTEAAELVMQSPYSSFVSALHKGTTP